MKRAFLKRTLLVLTALSLAGSVVGCKKNEAKKTDVQKTESMEVVKPESITWMATTVLTPEAGLDTFIQKFKEKTGIQLNVIKPTHNQYAEKVNLAFASGDIPDLLEPTGNLLVNMGPAGALFDMTELASKSEFLKSIDQKYIEGLKVNGRLYGYPSTTGGGTITYVRKDWLDANNLKIPTNYQEFLNMLKVFANDPDKNGKKDTIGITSAGLINSDPPYDIYLREFYQDATPDFIQVNGKWVDGMLEPSMKLALQRMREAYKEGLIDTEIVTNKTSTARDKFYAGKVGVFNYWAGAWNVTLEDNLKKTMPEASIVPIPAIKETKYIERTPTCLVIPAKAKNPEGIFKYFLEYIHDGGEGQMIMTHGFEGFSYEIKDGKYSKLPSLNDPKTLYSKMYLSPELALKPWNDPFTLDSRMTNSLNIFTKDSKVYTMLPASEELTKITPDLLVLKNEVISGVVFGRMTVEEGLEKYVNESKVLTESALKELNSKK